MDSFVSKVNRTIRLHSLLRKGDKVLVGVSGGPDSVCLLSVLLELQKKYQLDIYACHVNYGLRRSSSGDEKFVRALARSKHIKLFVQRAKPKAGSRTVNFEELAREIRYDFFGRLSEKHGFTKIALGHNANDQAETVIMRFLRGSSLKGLGGMSWRRDSIIRPLLNITRPMILEYLLIHGLKYRIDETNLDKRFTRNRIRHSLIPLIENEYNPSLTETLVKNADLYRQSWNVIKDVAKKKISAAEIRKNRSMIIVRWPGDKKTPRLIKSVMVMHVIKQLRGNVRNIGYEAFSNTVSYLDNPEKKENFTEIASLTIAKNNGTVSFKLSR